MKIPKIILGLSAALLIATTISTIAAEKNDGPNVTHFPTLIGYQGQPIPVYAQVQMKSDDSSVDSVSLHVADNPKGVATRIPMLTTRENDHYSATIPPSLLGGNDKIWYFIAAYDASTNLTQTRWYPIAIKDPDLKPSEKDSVPETGTAGSDGSPLPAGESTGVSYGSTIGYKEAGILAGAVVVGAIGVDAIGGSGGGGTSFDESNVVSVPAAGSSSGGFSSAPQDRVIDGSSVVGGRTITGVRVTLSYVAYNVPDRFQIIYEGSTIADTGDVSGSDTIQAIGNGSSPLVTIRVITPEGGTLWDWTATVEYSVLEPL